MPKSAQSPQRQQFRVLTVDDEPTLLGLIRMQLERTGIYRVKCLDRGRDVEKTASQWQPDIILLDYLLPDTDGGRVFQQIKNNPRLKHIPIILLTSLAREDTPLQAGVRPRRLTLAKPVSFDRLQAAIRLLTGQSNQMA